MNKTRKHRRERKMGRSIKGAQYKVIIGEKVYYSKSNPAYRSQRDGYHLTCSGSIVKRYKGYAEAMEDAKNIIVKKISS